MKSYIVESDFIYKGYRCVVVFGKKGFRCGYVGVDANNPLYEQDYYSGRLDFDVHGGLTYSYHSPEYPVESELRWLGFDCFHFGDGVDGDLVREYWGEELLYEGLYDEFPVRSKEYVERECKSLVEQIIELVGEKKE